MNRVAAGVVACAALVASDARSQSAATTEVVLKVERTYQNARLKNDVAAVNGLRSTDYVEIRTSGRIVKLGKTEQGPLNTTPGGDAVWTASRLDNLTARVYGDVAVVTGTRHTDVKNKADGKDRKVNLAYTHVWAKEQGDWRIVNAQTTAIPE